MSLIGSIFKSIQTINRSDSQNIDGAAKNVVASTENGGRGLGTALAGIGTQIKDAFVDGGGSAIGYAELFGLKYPVTNYSSQVSPTLTRGSRIPDGQMDKLAQQGFKGIVNLCDENDMDTAPATAAGINSFHDPIIDNTPATNDQMKAFLDFATNPDNEPCYVHCEAGKGRTGMAVSCYRMAVEGWPADKAIAEAKQFGMAMPDQAQFLQQFSQDLAAGKIEGYPKA
jgi:protein tyrosine phosphatase (PTP) superfamily phosphohydrolase (DUF442 family)